MASSTSDAECSIINDKDFGGTNALHGASAGGHLEVVKILVEGGADVNALDNDGQNALMHACLGTSDPEIIRWLLDRGVNVNQTNSFQCSAFHIASCKGNLATLKLLQAKGANIKAVDASGDDALIKVCRFSGDVSAVRWLINQGAIAKKVNNQGFTAFHYAAQDGNVEVLTCLHAADSTLIHMTAQQGTTPLMLASRNGHKEAVSLLMNLAGNLGNAAAANQNDNQEEPEGDVQPTSGNRLLVYASSPVSGEASTVEHQGRKVMKMEERDVPANSSRVPIDPQQPSTSDQGAQPNATALRQIIPNQLKINFSKRLGYGRYGYVYEGIYCGTKVAVKEVMLEGRKRFQNTPPTITNEIRISGQIAHPGIVSFMGYMFQQKPQFKSLQLVFELVDGDNLENILYNDNLTREYAFTESRRLDVLYQISQALTYLHLQEPAVIHGDIKPSNMMLSKHGIAKLCDLGLSKFKENKVISIKPTKNILGTPVYMPPEVLLHSMCTSLKGDVYSFGASAFEIIFTEPLWEIDGDLPIDALKRKVSTEKVPESLMKRRDHHMFDIIRKCVQVDHAERPKMVEVFEELTKLMG